MVTEGIAQSILEAESNPARFERYCCEVCSELEGVRIFSTSAKHDRGRDGRAIASGQGSHSTVLCSSLADRVDNKAQLDAKRLAATSSPDRIIFCSSQVLSEDRCDKIAADLRKILGGACSIAVLGASQLAELSARYEEAFRRNYKGEIDAIESQLLALTVGGQADGSGVLLALATFESSDAQALRAQVSANALLQVIHKNGPCSIGAAAVKLAGDLRLPSAFNARRLEEAAQRLQGQGLLDLSPAKITLTDAGKKAAEELPTAAARNLLQGRRIIKDKLNELTGVSLTDSQMKSVFASLLDSLSDAFYQEGLSVIRAVERFLSGSAGDVANGESLREILRRAAARAKATISSPELADEIEQAIIDMFTERSGPAFEWLASVCERFVTICSLGLESRSSSEVRELLRGYRVVLDSDIVLTLLCESEPDHQAAKQLVASWRRIGGQLMVAVPVLSEVANHAWISERDFQETKHLLGKLQGAELRRYVQNAFVRVFHSHATSPSDARRWRSFIDGFRGIAGEDYGNVLQSLRDEFGVELLPDNSDETLRLKIFSFLKTVTARRHGVTPESLDKKHVDKAARDSHLIGSVAAYRATLRRAGLRDACVLVSSSTRLAAADRKFRSDLGEPASVMSLGPFAYLLSLTSDAPLGAGALRRALFEFGESAHLPDQQRLALRIIRGSDEYHVPWAKRPSLMRRLQAAIHKEATVRGVPVEKVEAQFSNGEDVARPAALIASAVRELAIGTSTDDELRLARQEVALLEEKYQRLVDEVRASRQGGSKRADG